MEETKAKNNFGIIFLLVMLLGALAYILYFVNKPTRNLETPQTSPSLGQPVVQTTESTNTTKEMEVIKEFKVIGTKFSFDVTEIKVKQGDKVKITFVNKEGLHDWRVDEFDAKTKVINEGETDTVEFVASKTGKFEYYCSVGEHRKLGMKGFLIVE